MPSAHGSRHPRNRCCSITNMPFIPKFSVFPMQDSLCAYPSSLIWYVQNLVTHSYDFVNFLPYIPPYITFEPCEMLPGGEGCECINLGCTSPNSDAPSFFTSPNGAVVSGDTATPAAELGPAAISCPDVPDSKGTTEHERELLGVCMSLPHGLHAVSLNACVLQLWLSSSYLVRF